MFDIPGYATQCASCSTSQVQNNIGDLLSQLGFSGSQINTVKTAIGNHPVSPSALEPKVTELYNSAPVDVKPAAEYSAKKDKREAEPKKANSSINGAVSDPVIEPLTTYKVSTPKDIPDSNNSLEEQHPDTFGDKDKAGNWWKHNLLTGLYQRGLRNGYLFRSDVNGNTTIFIPGNTKFKTDRSLNLNAGALDFILSGPGYFESSEELTFKAPKITLIGDVKVIGPQTNTETLEVAKGVSAKSTMSVSIDATIGGRSFLGHNHPGDSGGTTGPVN